MALSEHPGKQERVQTHEDLSRKEERELDGWDGTGKWAPEVGMKPAQSTSLRESYDDMGWLSYACIIIPRNMPGRGLEARIS